MSSTSGISTNTSPSYIPATSGNDASNAAATGSTSSGSTPSTSPSTVTVLSAAGLAASNYASLAASMSTDAGIIGTLTGGTSNTNATTLLNNLVTAEQQTANQQAAVSGAATASTVANAAGSSASSTGSDSTGTSGTSSTGGTSTPSYVPGNTNANWEQVLQSNPSMASDAVNLQIEQGIVNTFA